MNPMRTRPARLLAAGLAAALVAAGAAFAEGFPARSLAEVVAVGQALAQQQTRSPKVGDLFFIPGTDGAARSAATYTGQSRPLDPRKQAFIAALASAGQDNEGYAALYAREYLFRSASHDYWLPVQSKVASYFAKELTVGQPVALYLRNAGGFRTAQGWEWILLVEEFEGPKDAKKPGPPGPAKPPAAASGPKLQT